MARLLGIDVGTTGCKLLLTDETGRVRASAGREYPLSTPRPGWSEQNPEDWWAGVEAAMGELDLTGLDAIGLAGQMHGSVFLDENGNVVRPALLWNDARTGAECAEIEAAVGSARLREITGNPALVGFTLPKVLWLRRNEPELFARVRTVMLPKDYIRYRLSGMIATDVSDASGVGALDLRARDWSDEVLGAVGLSRDLFPPVFESYQIAGRTKDAVPIAAGGGDQAAAAVGTGAVEPGIVSLSLGTSGVVFSALPGLQIDPTGAVHVFCHADGGYHAMGVVLSAGGGLRWYRDALGGGRSYDEIADSARTSEAGARGLSFLPYLAGERAPHNDPGARAAFVGATLAHGRAEFDRAVFEGVSFALADAWGALERLGAEARAVRVTSGGAKSALWTGILGDLFGTPLRRLEADEGPALGAALLAGVAAGVWPDVRAATRSAVREGAECPPRGEDLGGAYAAFRALYPALRSARETTWAEPSPQARGNLS